MAVLSSARQASLPGMCPVTEAVAELAAAGIEHRGAIYTKREVVEFILDLVGYEVGRPLHQYRLLEPSFGDGDFLEIAVERLLESWRSAGASGDPVEALAPCIRGVELHASSFEGTRGKVIALLKNAGLAADAAGQLTNAWLMQGDFLLADLPGTFDFVVGNPPYVRQELIPDALIAEYRLRYRTVFDRADIYIPFIERSLSLLGEGGTLGFICADRWMKNRYGGPLRQMVADGYHLKAYVDMTDTPAFHAEVIAYPAITIITKEKPGKTRIAHRPAIDKSVLDELARRLLSADPVPPDGPVKEMADVAAGAQPWILEAPDQLMLIRRLERDYPAIEDAGCKVGIGVATGADKAFIGPFDELDVEDDRKLPLAMTRDIDSGEVKWRGLGIVNPFADEGGLVDLDDYPRLKKYLEQRRDQIAKRHVAKKAPANWYRTIDRIYPALADRPKLLIPDIKGDAHIVYEEGRLYPHHNLYFIVSDEWDLRALQAVLRSGIARLFVSIYATRMRGGYLRFQAQYLRRIRLPRWQDVSTALKDELIDAAGRRDVEACNRAVAKLYGLSKQERAAIGGNGD
ncbi:Eco57I restriction-modification methylase domain-containing protein [Chelativorans intermedius]|uniref:site-specific DNA-methyltransferase (adenine-specific) n=1 Tax=Chelativorans intermedius TaxID=515947 RepID=A0ABV6DB61_9HYPH|nr:Eco57I restriction-modification methylase domain-containing protein [Chelativorans intermedius]MCT9000246.1 Eco57I restriction-modification methylase domain-containing protein [Chelativorans intermedius]